MTERSKAAKAADERFNVEFTGVDKLGRETFQSNNYRDLERNWTYRDWFIEGYEAALTAAGEVRDP